MRLRDGGTALLVLDSLLWPGPGFFLALCADKGAVLFRRCSPEMDPCSCSPALLDNAGFSSKFRLWIICKVSPTQEHPYHAEACCCPAITSSGCRPASACLMPLDI